jgi:hypothetical protein
VLEDTYLASLLTDKEYKDLSCTFHIKYPLNWTAEDSKKRYLEVKLDLILAGCTI